jgi:long-chain acyl-CoA synthetase
MIAQTQVQAGAGHQSSDSNVIALRPRQRWTNLVEMFFDQAARFGEAPLLWTKADGAWKPLSWRQTAERVARLAGGLQALGVKPGDRIVLVSENRPEWFICDMAIMAIGAITVPAYTTNTEQDHRHILENSGASVAIVSTAKLARSLLPAAYQTETCKAIIGIEPLRIGQASITPIYALTDLLESAKTTPADARAMAKGFGRKDVACINYTSGTGGAPRGVVLSHGSMLANVEGGEVIVTEDFPPDPDKFLSFLPLSHAYEHTMGQFFAISRGAQVYYAESLDKLASNLEEVQPTIVVVVPRLFEVLRQRIIKAIDKQGLIARFLLKQALRLGEKKYTEGQLGWFERLFDQLLDRTIRAKVKARFGGKNKALVSGGAPLNPEVGMFFVALGLTLLQGYGQTEAAPLISCNRPKARIKMHSVGPPVPGVDVRIADDGEILVRGEAVMEGYWRNPEETARALQNGWLHTGDIGHIDGNGHIVITDRKKDIIVNDKGDNVSPQRVEGMLTLEPEILQAMVYGDKRPHLVALVVPDPEWLADWAKVHGKPADLKTLRHDNDLNAAVMAAVDRINARLSVMERVRKILLAEEPFSVDNQQMTPTLKVRRHILKARYGDELNGLY